MSKLFKFFFLVVSVVARYCGGIVVFSEVSDLFSRDHFVGDFIAACRVLKAVSKWYSIGGRCVTTEVEVF